MSYIENPKTKGSGIICGIPQKGTCPVRCPDCFFQTGRSYLEPLDKNLPNMPSEDRAEGFVVRMNDGNDSNNQRNLVMREALRYTDVFLNTSMTEDLEGYGGPVVLTVNPGHMTDKRAHLIDPVPPNLMMVRFRVNTWNLDLLDKVVEHYTARNVPVILTFMAYYEGEIPADHKWQYEWKQRTTNSYWVTKPGEWGLIKDRYRKNPLVHTCGVSPSDYKCRNCGNCIREYFVTKARLHDLRDKE